jgi:2-iminobutanoate/2-iminopropanoate deaminase
MPRTIITSPEAPEPIGPYSQAIKCGGFLFTAGQIAMEKMSGKIVPGGVEKQTKQVLKNLNAVLKSASMDLQHVVKTTIYLKNMDDFSVVNQIYADFFKGNKPVRTTVEVSRLPGNVLIEMDWVAYQE